MAQLKIKTVKKEDPEHIGDPNKLNLTDATATKILNQQSLPQEFKQLGIGCTKMLDATPTYNIGDCEYEIKHENINAGIVLGRDRPSDKLSGYGGCGVKRSAMIDIVVGRMGPEAATTNGQNEILYCENNMTMDASRVYISQRTNIDKNFRIRTTEMPQTSCAGIGIKSDCIRIIGRRDIKIVTGTDYYDSNGGVVGVDYTIPKKIMLIGDNRADLLQPMVLGNNLQSMLYEILESMSNITSTMSQFILHQNKINFAVMNHKHRDRLNINQFGFLSEDLLKLFITTTKLTTEVEASLIEIDAQLTALEAEYIMLPNDGMNNNSNILSNYNYCN